MLVGESIRSLDDRYRLSLPPELCEELGAEGGELLLTKERPGCLGLWRPERVQEKLEQGQRILESKIAAGRLEGRLAEVQALGRLLSTRHRSVQLAGRGRLSIPEGFREFLGVEPGGSIVVVGAAVCVELWRPESWSEMIDQQMPEFGKLFDELTA